MADKYIERHAHHLQHAAKERLSSMGCQALLDCYMVPRGYKRSFQSQVAELLVPAVAVTWQSQKLQPACLRTGGGRSSPLPWCQQVRVAQWYCRGQSCYQHPATTSCYQHPANICVSANKAYSLPGRICALQQTRMGHAQEGEASEWAEGHMASLGHVQWGNRASARHSCCREPAAGRQCGARRSQRVSAGPRTAGLPGGHVGPHAAADQR